MDKICCVTGHRPQNFPWDYDNKLLAKIYLQDIKELVIDSMRKGYNYFISGGAIGVDLDFAEAVLRAKKRRKDIKLEIAVPCRNQALKWSVEDKERYYRVLESANTVTVLSEHYTRRCMQKRNEYMVDKSDYVIAVWNLRRSGGTYNTLTYAQKKGKKIIFHDLTMTVPAAEERFGKRLHSS